MSHPLLDLIESLIPDDWRHYAECKGMDPDLFFPDRGDNISTRKAKEVCAICIVREECFEYAVEASEDSGIWGGAGVTGLEAARRLRMRPHAA